MKMPEKEFKEALRNKVWDVDELLEIPTVYKAISKHFKPEILKEWNSGEKTCYACDQTAKYQCQDTKNWYCAEHIMDGPCQCHKIVDGEIVPKVWGDE